MNAVPTVFDLPDADSEKAESAVLEMTSQKILTGVLSVEIEIKRISEKCAEAIGIFAHLRKYDRARFSTLWEPSKGNLFGFQEKIPALVESYGRAIAAVVGEKPGIDYAIPLMASFRAAEIRDESDFDTDRPLKFAKFANLIQSWENHPDGDVSPSGVIGRAVTEKVMATLRS